MSGVITQTFEGYTNASYDNNTLKFDCSRRNVKTISLRNGDAALDLTYKIIGYYDANEKASKNLRTENTLAAGEVYTTNVADMQFHHITCFIKSSTVRCKYYVVENLM